MNLKSIEKHFISVALNLIVFPILFNSCSSRKQWSTFYQSNKTQYRDSIYIIHTLKAWSLVPFDIYNDKLSKNLSFKVSKVFYSPDSLKMIAWVSEKQDNNHSCNIKQGYVYTATGIVGYRDYPSAKWKLYPLSLIKPTCLTSDKQIIEVFSKFYFKQMKNSSESVNNKFIDNNYGGKIRYDYEKIRIKNGYGDSNGVLIDKNFGFNLQDKYFWQKSLLWQKGARIPGLYNFQTRGDVRPDDKMNPQMVTPKVIYPDSTLNLYK